MRPLPLFDLHCDTAYEAERQNLPLLQNDLAVSLEKASHFSPYIQVMALWTHPTLSDEEGFCAYQRMLAHLRKDPSVRDGSAILSASLPKRDDARPHFLLAVEDARLVGDDFSRVDRLFHDGVRILTPLWKGKTRIGGSHDTEEGLTDFGKDVLRRALSLGMLPDISHASRASAEDIFTLAAEFSRPVLATHSNAWDLCPVSRNLTKEQIASILASDGLIGLNLYTRFLCADGNAKIDDILRHVAYFLENGCERHLALGCDMDGADLPEEIGDIRGLSRLADALLRRYPEDLVRNLYFENAYRLFARYLP